MLELKTISEVDDTFPIERQLSEEIKCPICLEACKEPKILPCQHTFCLECLENAAKQNNPHTVDCPQCRKEYRIPYEKGGVRGFPENRLMKFLLEKKNKIFPPQRTLSSSASASNTDQFNFLPEFNTPAEVQQIQPNTIRKICNIHYTYIQK